MDPIKALKELFSYKKTAKRRPLDINHVINKYKQTTKRNLTQRQRFRTGTAASGAVTLQQNTVPQSLNAGPPQTAKVYLEDVKPQTAGREALPGTAGSQSSR